MGRNTAAPGANGILEDARYQVPGLERALQVLEHLDEHPAGRTLAEIALALRLPKNSVFRITTTLLRRGYLDRAPVSRRFTLSHKVLALGYRTATDGSLTPHALDAMRDLRDRVRETVALSVLADGEGLVLDQVQGLHPFRFVAEAGARQPLHASASTKAILAFLPDAERDALLRRARLDRLTPRTRTTLKAIRGELDRVRRQGYALDRGEHLRGVHCVAAPILDRHGHPVASITVTGPADRMPESTLDGLGRQVREHADRVTKKLQHGPSSTGPA